MNINKESNLSFTLLTSIIASGKKEFHLTNETNSFYIVKAPPRQYIEQNFKKIEFDYEKPKIILISAVGATGKTALARELSNQLKLPILDLAKHKPVGDNTLTGILSTGFKVDNLSDVFQSMEDGKYGVIIDGVDEGRSKTSEKAFEAFLDDIILRAGSQNLTTFIILGRTRVLEDCWLYFTEKDVSTNLISIQPFSLENARKYIDTFSKGLETNQKSQYIEARDSILNGLQKAFHNKSQTDETDYLSFIGYPPVLDSIVTLLTEERNHHKLLEKLSSSDGDSMEISLLTKIAEYILLREKDDKVIPNIVTPLIKDLPSPRVAELTKNTFSIEEQCVRLLSHSLDKALDLNTIEESVLNAQYEKQLSSFFHEHPFLIGKNFNNAIFESFVIATLILSNKPAYEQMVLDYFKGRKYNYYLIYLLQNLSANCIVSRQYISTLIASALEFKASNSQVGLTVESKGNEATKTLVEIEIEISFDNGNYKMFEFKSETDESNTVYLGSTLDSTFVNLQNSNVHIGGAPELELISPIQIEANTIVLTSPSLVLKSSPNTPDEFNHIFFESKSLETEVERITLNDLKFIINLEEVSNIGYPLHQHIAKKELGRTKRDEEKYVGLRKILMQFRSHSKGSLARFKDKIESDHVLTNDTGRKLLQALVNDGVLVLQGRLYYLKQDAISQHLGISYVDLKMGQSSEKLLSYLGKI